MTILKINNGGTRKNGPTNNKFDYFTLVLKCKRLNKLYASKKKAGGLHRWVKSRTPLKRGKKEYLQRPATALNKLRTKRKTSKTRKQRKQLHGHFKRQTREFFFSREDPDIAEENTRQE